MGVKFANNTPPFKGGLNILQSSVPGLILCPANYEIVQKSRKKNRARVDPVFPGGPGIPGPVPSPAAGSLVLFQETLNKGTLLICSPLRGRHRVG